MPTFQEFFDAHAGQIAELAEKFNSYVFPVDRTCIRNWLRLFGEENLELGLKLLNNIDYYSPSRLVTESRELHQQLLAYKRMNNNELLTIPTYFVDSSPTPGRSQSEFIPKYRLGSDLRYDRFNKNFIFLPELNKFMDKEGVTLVFLSDFIGSGKQITDAWLDNLWTISDKNEHILLTPCGYDSGIRKIEKLTENRLTVITNRRYSNENRVFSAENTNFTAEEKDIIKRSCNLAGDFPEGFNKTQSTTIFYFRCPNSVISLFRATSPDWNQPLFSRHRS